MSYRTIWKRVHGEIPKGYHIHHIDGDHNNNKLENLRLVSHYEHFEVHYNQCDWHAAFLLSKGLNIDAERMDRIKEGIRSERIPYEPYKSPTIDFESEPCPHCASVVAYKYPNLHWDNCPALKGGYSLLLDDKTSLAWRLFADRFTEDKTPNLTCPHCGRRNLNNKSLKRSHWDNCPALKNGWSISEQIAKKGRM